MQKLFRDDLVSGVRKKLDEQGLESLTPNEMLVHVAAFFNDETTSANAKFETLVTSLTNLAEDVKRAVRVVKWVVSTLVALVVCIVGSIIAFFILGKG